MHKIECNTRCRKGSVARYLSEECLHGGPVLQTWQPVQASHEGLTQVPWARPISAAHHVHPISIRGGCLPDQMAVHGAPGGVGEVVVPPVVPLLLVRRLLHPQRSLEEEQDKEEEGEGETSPLSTPRQHRVPCAFPLLHI